MVAFGGLVWGFRSIAVRWGRFDKVMGGRGGEEEEG